MAKCKNCNNLYNMTDITGENIGNWCPNINDCPDIEIERECEYCNAMTNADRIRNMTDEELAKTIIKKIECNSFCEYHNGLCCEFDHVCTEEFAIKNALEWLQKEVE